MVGCELWQFVGWMDGWMDGLMDELVGVDGRTSLQSNGAEGRITITSAPAALQRRGELFIIRRA